VWPAPMKYRLPLCGADAIRCLRLFGYFAYERKGFWPTAESAVGLVGPLYGNCYVGMAKCGQGVLVDVKTNGQSDTVDVRRVSSCCTLQRAKITEVRKN
jgi:hypothetical protein